MNQGNWVDIFFVTLNKGFCSIAFEYLPKPLNPLLPRLLFCRLRHLIGHSNVRLVVFVYFSLQFLISFHAFEYQSMKMWNFTMSGLMTLHLYVFVLVFFVGRVLAITTAQRPLDLNVDDKSVTLRLKLKDAEVPGLVFDHSICQLYAPLTTSAFVRITFHSHNSYRHT